MDLFPLIESRYEVLMRCFLLRNTVDKTVYSIYVRSFLEKQNQFFSLQKELEEISSKGCVSSKEFEQLHTIRLQLQALSRVPSDYFLTTEQTFAYIDELESSSASCLYL